MPALKIENVQNIAARAKFVDGDTMSGGAHAYVEVTFEQKETGYGLGWEHVLDGFVVSCILRNPPLDGSPTYGWTLKYDDLYRSLEARDLERMYRFLSQLEKAMARADEKMGRCLSFGQHVVRVCNLLGVDYGLADNGNRFNRQDVVHYSKIGEFQFPIDDRIRSKNEDWHGARFWAAKR